MDTEDRQDLMTIDDCLFLAQRYNLGAEVVFFAMEYYRNQKDADKTEAFAHAMQEWDL